MIRATPHIRDLARRVVTFEMGRNGAPAHATPVAFAICEKLRPQWANLMGSIGFRTMLSRALTIAIPEAGWLETVVVKADGSLEWADKSEAPMDAEETSSGSAVLVAELFGLLEGFIGETLALRLMQDVWPKLPRYDSDSDKGK